jgi:hypothetical protein
MSFSSVFMQNSDKLHSVFMEKSDKFQQCVYGKQ